MINDNLPLFIFEMANNHQGSVEHGKQIIRALRKACEGFPLNFAVKLQYRDLESFIHPDYKDRMDIKHIKRFSDTRLQWNEYLELKNEIEANGFISVCTPFDEVSVDMILEHGFNIIKIASCSLTDWSLLEKISLSGKPVIASTAGASLYDIDQVHTFFTNRRIELALMHCVAEYPSKAHTLQLNQIDVLKNRFKDTLIGYSTHEEPGNYEAVKIAIAKGARLFEKHTGLPANNVILNDYSANPEQVHNWLLAAQRAYEMCGISNQRHDFSNKEIADLAALKRGVFARTALQPGDSIDSNNTFLAFPCEAGQLLANDLSKYKRYTISGEIAPNHPVSRATAVEKDRHRAIENIIRDVRGIIGKSGIAIPAKTKCELSHHYGLERFDHYGAAIIDIINREYCKKIIVLLPGQEHPNHLHRMKDETFTLLYGDMSISMNGDVHNLAPGEVLPIERGCSHSFSSANGAIIEEISTTHFINDSFYDDMDIMNNENRKTVVYLLE